MAIATGTTVYRAKLRGNTLEWEGTPPPESAVGIPVEVNIVAPAETGARFITEAELPRPEDLYPPEEVERRRSAWRALFAAVDARGGCRSFPDDVAGWIEDGGTDRPLPGRETDE